jgi:energy-coupling factor transporter ATP-binding protein EcfA2
MKYFGTWLGAQVLINATWIVKAINAAHAGNGVSLPEGTETITAVLGAFLSGFAIKVWKELEERAVRGTVKILSAAPRVAIGLLGRVWDHMAGFLTCWWPGNTRRYYREIQHIFGIFNDKGLGLINANRLDLERVYVELLASSDVNLNRPALNLIAHPIRERASIWHHIHTQRPGFALVVIGAPGCGKTTLLQHVLLTFAAHKQYRHRLRAKIPVFIEIRRLPAVLGETAAIEFADAVQLVIKQDRRYVDIAGLPTTWLRHKLRGGKCVLLLDGLDEIADESMRKKVSAWLDRAIGSRPYSKNLFLISARPAGYRSARLDRAQILEVQPFTYPDTQRFIYRWYHANEVIARGNLDNKNVRRAAKQEADALLERLAANRGIAGLTSNPLLLTMVCMVHRYHGALPGSRGQLYAEICQVLLERWRQTRSIDEPYSANQKLEVLRPIAAKMMADHTRDITQGSLIELVAEPLSRIGVPRGTDARFISFKTFRTLAACFWSESPIFGRLHISAFKNTCVPIIGLCVRPSDLKLGRTSSTTAGGVRQFYSTRQRQRMPPTWLQLS